MTTHENGDQTVSDERDLKSHQIMELTRELDRVRAEKAEAAIERVLALADEYDRTIAGRTLDGVAMRPFYHGGSVCSRIRAAIAGPQ